MDAPTDSQTNLGLDHNFYEPYQGSALSVSILREYEYTKAITFSPTKAFQHDVLTNRGSELYVRPSLNMLLFLQFW